MDLMFFHKSKNPMDHIFIRQAHTFEESADTDGANGDNGKANRGGAEETGTPKASMPNANEPRANDPIRTVLLLLATLVFGVSIPISCAGLIGSPSLLQAFYLAVSAFSAVSSNPVLSALQFLLPALGNSWLIIFIVCIAVVLLSLLLLFLLIRYKKTAIATILLCVLVGLLFGPFAVSLLLGVVFATALCSLMVSTHRLSLPWLLPLAAGAYVGSLVLTADPVLSLLALLPFLTACFLCHANADGARRAEVIVRITIGLALSLALLLCFILLLRYGHLELSGLKSAIDALRPGWTELIQKVSGRLDPQTAEALANNLLNRIPGALLMCLLFVGDLVWWVEIGLFHWEVRRTAREPFLGSMMEKLELSTVSGGLFILAMILSLFGANGGVFFVALDNFTLLLLPPMLLAGVRRLILVHRHRRSPLWLLPVALVALAAFAFGIVSALSILLDAIALVGATDTLFRPAREALEALRKSGGFPPKNK